MSVSNNSGQGNGTTSRFNIFPQRHSWRHKFNKVLGLHAQDREQKATLVIQQLVGQPLSLSLSKTEQGKIRNHIYSLPYQKQTRTITQESNNLGESLGKSYLKKEIKQRVNQALDNTANEYALKELLTPKESWIQTILRAFKLGTKSPKEKLVDNLVEKLIGLHSTTENDDDFPSEIEIKNFLNLSLKNLIGDNPEASGPSSSGVDSEPIAVESLSENTTDPIVRSLFPVDNAITPDAAVKTLVKGYQDRVGIDQTINRIIINQANVTEVDVINKMRPLGLDVDVGVMNKAVDRLANQTPKALAEFIEAAEDAVYHKASFTNDQLHSLFHALTGIEYTETSPENSANTQLTSTEDGVAPMSRVDADNLMATLKKNLGTDGNRMLGERSITGYSVFMNKLAEQLEEKFVALVTDPQSGFADHLAHSLRTTFLAAARAGKHTISGFVESRHKETIRKHKAEHENVQKLLTKLLDSKKSFPKFAQRLINDKNFMEYSINVSSQGFDREAGGRWDNFCEPNENSRMNEGLCLEEGSRRWSDIHEGGARKAVGPDSGESPKARMSAQTIADTETIQLENITASDAPELILPNVSYNDASDRSNKSESGAKQLPEVLQTYTQLQQAVSRLPNRDELESKVETIKKELSTRIEVLSIALPLLTSYVPSLAPANSDDSSDESIMDLWKTVSETPEDKEAFDHFSADLLSAISGEYSESIQSMVVAILAVATEGLKTIHNKLTEAKKELEDRNVQDTALEKHLAATKTYILDENKFSEICALNDVPKSLQETWKNGLKNKVSNQSQGNQKDETIDLAQVPELSSTAAAVIVKSLAESDVGSIFCGDNKQVRIQVEKLQLKPDFNLTIEGDPQSAPYTGELFDSKEEYTEYLISVLENPSEHKSQLPVRFTDEELLAVLKFTKEHSEYSASVAESEESDWTNLFGRMKSTTVAMVTTAASAAGWTAPKISLDLSRNLASNSETGSEKERQNAQELIGVLLPNFGAGDEVEFGAEKRTLLKEALKNHPKFQITGAQAESFALRLADRFSPPLE